VAPSFEESHTTDILVEHLCIAELKCAELFTQARDGRIKSLLIAAKLSQLLLSDDRILI